MLILSRDIFVWRKNWKLKYIVKDNICDKLLYAMETIIT